MKLKNGLAAKYYPYANWKTQQALKMCVRQLRAKLSKTDIRELRSKQAPTWWMLEISIRDRRIQLLIGYPIDRRGIRGISKLEPANSLKWANYVIYQNKAHVNNGGGKGYLELERELFTYAIEHKVTPEVAGVMLTDSHQKEEAIR
jgi:hypothetical protein